MKTVGIEEFAAWCVQSEWPKVRSAEMDEDALTRAAILGAMGLPDRPGHAAGSGGMDWSLMVGEGSLPAIRVAGVPHVDAVLFSEACRALEAEASSPPYDVDDCLTDMRSLLEMGPQERPATEWRAASAHLRGRLPKPKDLVLSYAAMAMAPTGKAKGWAIKRPDWHPDAIDRRYVQAESGGHPRWFVTIQRRIRVSERGERPVYEVRAFEEDGRCPKTRRPRPGAYRKVAFDPDPGFVARERHIYAVWWCALEWLAAWMEASGALSAHCVKGPQDIEKPWR